MDNQNNHKWYPYQAQTDGVPMVDGGIGAPMILETFEFAINPAKVKELEEKKIKVTNQEIFDNHWPQLKAVIWSKGLVAITEPPFNPRVVMGKKRYRIFVLCEPKFRKILHDKPKTLQEIFKKTRQDK